MTDLRKYLDIVNEENDKIDEIVDGPSPNGLFAHVVKWIGQALGEFPSDAEIAQRRGDGQRAVPSRLDSLERAYDAFRREADALQQENPQSFEEIMAHSQKVIDLSRKSIKIIKQIQAEQDRILGRDRDQEDLARQQGQFIQDLERQINNQS